MVQGFCGTLSCPLSLPLSLNAFSTHHHTSITILDCIMGCNASTINADRANLPAATRLRPLVLRQLAEMKTWRLPAFPARATPYKKGLLLEADKDQTTTAPSTAVIAANPYVVKVAAKLNQIRAIRKNHTPKLQIATARSKSIDDRKADGDEDDDEGRMIGASPGSPSFRVFFEDAARAGLVDQNGENEDMKEADDSDSKEKKVKREGKRKRNIKSAMTEKRREAGNAVKNLLNVKGCYHPPTSLKTKL